MMSEMRFTLFDVVIRFIPKISMKLGMAINFMNFTTVERINFTRSTVVIK